MQITVRLSRKNDLELYVYFMREEKRSILIKALLSDYIHGRRPSGLGYITETAQTLEYETLPKELLISVFLGKAASDQEIAGYFSDCPKGMRAHCIRSVLKIMVAPYAQNVYHTKKLLAVPDFVKEYGVEPAGILDGERFWSTFLRGLMDAGRGFSWEAGMADKKGLQDGSLGDQRRQEGQVQRNAGEVAGREMEFAELAEMRAEPAPREAVNEQTADTEDFSLLNLFGVDFG